MKRYSKYGNKKTVVDGHKFDSIKESKRYCQLKLLERAGEIADLELQPKYPFEYEGVKICCYKADFKYIDLKTHTEVVEDVKSTVTASNPVYRIKKKLMKAFYGVEIFEA